MANELWDMVSLEQGSVAVVAQNGCLLRVCFECSADDIITTIRRDYPEARQSSQALLENSLEQLREYFLGKRRFFNVPLGTASLTAFTLRVQQALLDVPYGSVVSYGALAAMAGSPRAARAVGGVMSSNPFPLIVPCHRVVNADGRIGHYSAAHGSKTKAWLIDFERSMLGT